MAKPNKKGSRGKPAQEMPPNTSRLFIEIDDAIKAALVTMARKEGRTIKAQAERLFREILTAKGYLAPDDEATP